MGTVIALGPSTVCAVKDGKQEDHRRDRRKEANEEGEDA